MKCKKCKNEIFKIESRNKCGECLDNGAYSDEDDEFIYDKERIDELGITRNEAAENNSCVFGCNWDSGCYVFECFNCKEQSHLAMMIE